MQPVNIISNQPVNETRQTVSQPSNDAFYQHLLSCLSVNNQVQLNVEPINGSTSDLLEMPQHNQSSPHELETSELTNDYQIGLKKNLTPSGSADAKFEIGFYKAFGLRISAI